MKTSAPGACSKEHRLDRPNSLRLSETRKIGTPFCLTVDNQTMTDNMVTLRDRDSLVQERVALKGGGGGDTAAVDEIATTVCW